MKNKFLILFGILFLLNLSLVSSHFVCGIVENSDENISASWYNVKVFYPETEVNYVTCEVSPEGNKYCCDITSKNSFDSYDIGKAWEIGDVLFAKVVDLENGYSAGPVSVILSGGGYDVAPTMKLEKVINIHSPSKKVILSNSTLILLNASFLSPYNEVEILNKDEEVLVSGNFTNYNGELSFDFGMNYLKFFASDGVDTFEEESSFALLNYVEFNRSFECENCKKDKVKSSSSINVNLNLNLSHEVEGFVLKEYVPSSWAIEDLGGGEIGEFNENYNVVYWTVSGKDISVQYSVHTPSVFIRPQKFSFKSELEDFVLGVSNITVYRFFSFWAIVNVDSFDFGSRGYVVNIDSSHAFVFGTKSGVLNGGIFVNDLVNKARFRIAEYNFRSPISGIETVLGFNIWTSLREDKVENILFEVRLKKDSVELDKLRFFIKYRTGWEEVSAIELDEDENYFYFYFDTDLFRRFLIGQEKESFFLRFF